MYQKPTAPRSIGGVLDDTFRLCKASFKKCVPAVLVGGAAMAVANFYQINQTSSPAAGMQALFGANGTATSPLAGLFSLLAGMIQYVCYASMIYTVWAMTQGEAPSFGKAFGLAWRRLLSMIGAGIIVGFVAGIGFLVALVPVFISFPGRPPNGQWQQVIAQMLPSILIAMVLLIPVTYVVTRMSLYLVPLITESQGSGKSVGTSWRLVGGNWWRTTTVLFVIFAVAYLLAIGLIAIAGAVTGIAFGGVTGASRGAEALAIVTAGTVTIVRMLLAPLTASLFVVLYQDLLLRKGGGDLESRLGALPKG
jgi:hypothetical protein